MEAGQPPEGQKYNESLQNCSQLREYEYLYFSLFSNYSVFFSFLLARLESDNYSLN